MKTVALLAKRQSPRDRSLPVDMHIGTQSEKSIDKLLVDLREGRAHSMKLPAGGCGALWTVVVRLRQPAPNGSS